MGRARQSIRAAFRRFVVPLYFRRELDAPLGPAIVL